MQSSFQNVYQIKISLIGSNPEIWRKIQIPEDYNFWELHVAVQDAMGWRDIHSHQFRIKKPGRKKYIHIGFNGGENELHGKDELVRNYMKCENDTVRYLYNFIDGWIHLLILERILLKEPGQNYPICLDGEMACPPEASGGINVFNSCLEPLKGPNNRDYQLVRDWLGEEFDPTEFDPRSVRFSDPEKSWNKDQTIPF